MGGEQWIAGVSDLRAAVLPERGVKSAAGLTFHFRNVDVQSGGGTILDSSSYGRIPYAVVAMVAMECL